MAGELGKLFPALMLAMGGEIRSYESSDLAEQAKGGDE